jgi:hypothetical protein
MKNRFSILIYVSFLLFSCSNNESKYSNETDSVENSLQDNDSNEKLQDGTYCAEIEYRNPNTRTHSTYTLTVEVENNEVIQINFPNGGWMDQDHFNGAELDDEGNASFTSRKGYDYEIQISSNERDCSADYVSRAQQCSGTIEEGNQCENMTDNSNGLCWQHQDEE